MVLIWVEAGKDPMVEAKRTWVKVEILLGVSSPEALEGEATIDGGEGVQDQSPVPAKSVETYFVEAHQCPPRKPVAQQAEAPSVYRWTDDQGRTHFSDAVPRSDINASEHKLARRANYFDLVFLSGQSALPTLVLDRMRADLH